MKKIALALCVFLFAISAPSSSRELGIHGAQAPEFGNFVWFNKKGDKIAPVKLSDYKGKVVYLDFFQSWCPGCLRYSLPRIKVLSDKYKNNPDIQFLAVQTVFEGFSVNSQAKVMSIRNRYGLEFPMGHDDGSHAGVDGSVLMRKYRSGGTPWTVIINREGRVLFNDFHIKEENAIRIIEASLHQTASGSN